jgi:hypothetical protein
LDSFNSLISVTNLGLTFWAIYALCQFISRKLPNFITPSLIVGNNRKGEKLVEPSSDHGRVSLLLSLLSFPAVSLIVRWILLRYNYDFIVICNQKSKFISFDVTSLRTSKSVPLRNYSTKKVPKLGWEMGLVLLVAATILLYLPISQLFAFVGFNIAERCLYPIMIPFSISIGLGFEYLVSHRDISRKLSWVILAILALQTQNRVGKWKSDLELSKNGAETGSIKSKVNLAIALANLEQFSLAKHILEETLTLTNHADIYYNL